MNLANRSENITTVNAIPESKERTSGVHEAVIEEVDFKDAISTETPERAKRRRDRCRRLAMESRAIDERVKAMQNVRWLNDSHAVADIFEYHRALEALHDGKIKNEEAANGGANGTTILELEQGHETIRAFQKSEIAELAQFINPGTGELVTAKTVHVRQPNGLYLRETRYVPSAPSQSLTQEKNTYAHFSSREDMEEDYVAAQEAFYGLEPKTIPVVKSEFGLRSVEVGHSVVREYVCATVDAITGLNTVPVTVMKTDGEELFSRQKGLENALMLDDPAADLDGLLKAVMEKKPHPAKKSLMRLAVLHDIVEYSDGHTGNMMMDADETDPQVHGIDFGYAFPRHYLGGDQQPTSWDPIMSGAMQIVELDPEWKLDEEALGSLRQVRDDIMDYLKYQAMKDGADLKADEKSRLLALPEEVKKGEVAKLLSKLLTMVYEVDGKPEVTAAIAKKEAELFLQRIDRIVQTGRPRLPNHGIKESRFARVNELTRRVEELKEAL